MENKIRAELSRWVDDEGLERLAAIDNPEVHELVLRYAHLCRPDSIFVSADLPADLAVIRQAAVAQGEEEQLAIEGHTIHFDGYADQGRDQEHTRFLLEPGVNLGADIASTDRTEGLAELERLLEGAMAGKRAWICFFSLGPSGSEFSIPAVQITDSAYVAHSEAILYRPGYQELVRQGRSARFFRFIHSSGELDERRNSRNVPLRRIYIDCPGGQVFSVNTQYGGNTIGLKKLAMRLAIYRAEQEGWLTEHMMLMGLNGPKGRVTYIGGAFPSMCGKTSTAMIRRERMVGDDIAYLHRRDGKAVAVNVEAGMFGIIMGVNQADDPLVWEVLHSPGEVIFSNVLLGDNGRPHWLGMGEPISATGRNHWGNWSEGQEDARGRKVDPSHKNARFTVALKRLANADERLDDPAGVPLKALLYGGRDSDTWVPVQEAFDWNHGIITKAAALESESTAATLGKEGVRTFNPMSNIDFLSVPLGRYIEMNLQFGAGLVQPPRIFGTNYFLQGGQGQLLTGKNDKGVWLKWIELRVNDEVKARRTPTGLIPCYEDLRLLFDQVLGVDYAPELYRQQFTLRVAQNLAKNERITRIYREQEAVPALLFELLAEERERLLAAGRRWGDLVEPGAFLVE